MRGVRYAEALNVAAVYGVLPEPGGVLDQEAPFAESLGISADEQVRQLRKVKPGA